MLDHLDRIDEDVKEGKIQGNSYSFPVLTGQAYLYDIGIRNSGGSTFLEIALSLKDNPMCRKTFSLWLPSPSSNANAQFMAMQRLYSTLFAAAKKQPKDIKFSALYNQLEKVFEEKSILVEFVLKERKSFSDKTGKEFVNQDLESLTFVSMGPKIEKPAKPETKPQASSANWGNEEVPF
jgi:hypothetical protein